MNTTSINTSMDGWINKINASLSMGYAGYTCSFLATPRSSYSSFCVLYLMPCVISISLFSYFTLLYTSLHLPLAAQNTFNIHINSSTRTTYHVPRTTDNKHHLNSSMIITIIINNTRSKGKK